MSGLFDQVPSNEGAKQEKSQSGLSAEAFAKLSPLTKTYELRRDRTYLVICDGKHFSQGLANALFAQLREEGINVHVVVSAKPKAIEIKEGPQAQCTESS